ncbi:MAG: signal peptidase I [Nocardioidaceae bacterium]
MSAVRPLARRLGRGVLHTLAWAALLALLAVLAAAVVVPRLGGATPYAIETGSMTPALPPGTLVVVRPTATADIGVGSVVTYQLRSGRPEVVTHRVVATAVDGAGRQSFRTQGDANDTPDEGWVRPVQIRGTLWYAVPGLGRVNTLLTGREHQVAVYVAAGALAGYALVLFGSDARRLARRRHGRHLGVAGVAS